ncbi:MAG TPA: phosphotransferase family protein [Candidatus Acidoferrales bacterium]|nr:phosphotransferase family protein [Candidatus Acidoferrales bacterium]
MAARSETIAMRAGERIATDALAAYLRDKLEGAEHGVELEQFPNGHSNLTYLLRAGPREYVLRRPPLGPVAPKAHDMVREYHVLRAVHHHFPQAPQAHLVCEDMAVLGAPFFVMERRRGVILREEIPAEFQGIKAHPRMIGEAFLDSLVDLHQIEISASDLRELGKPDGYVERQVRGWADRWERAKTEEVSELDAVVRWLGANIPTPLAPSLIHNDYKLDNIMLGRGSPDHIEAVLDWEMATLGDPLSDLGLTLCYWVWATAPEVRTAGIPALTSLPGWYSRDELVDRYARRTGRDVTHIGYYEVLGVFKLAVIVQQIYCRFHRGQTQDERFRDFGARAAALGGLAARLAGRYS